MGVAMPARRYDSTDHVGVNAVERVVTAEFKWIWRPQNVADFGVDGQIEVVDDDGRPTGQLFGVQVKSGPSYFHRSQDAVAFYVDDEHLKYWDQHILPVILVLHNPQDGETLWQWASLRAAKRTGKGWRIDVPRTKTLTAASKAELRNEEWAADDNVGLRHRFALDLNLMKEFEGREAFVTIDAWVNKTLMYRSIEIRFDDPMKEEVDHILPIMATGHFTIKDIMRLGADTAAGGEAAAGASASAISPGYS
jgi:hypothetical protein